MKGNEGTVLFAYWILGDVCWALEVLAIRGSSYFWEKWSSSFEMRDLVSTFMFVVDK